TKAEKHAAKEHYPAPYRLIDLWEEHGSDANAMQRAEITSFSELLASETAQNLVRVFFLREKLKGAAKGESGIRHVHVIGAGTMGGDIAAWCAARGLRVTLADLDRNVIAKAIGRAA
ncbi:MAG: fatty-acid oxidation protein subunit alpha, partial [Mesorhizobium sp.]